MKSCGLQLFENKIFENWFLKACMKLWAMKMGLGRWPSVGVGPGVSLILHCEVGDCSCHFDLRRIIFSNIMILTSNKNM